MRSIRHLLTTAAVAAAALAALVAPAAAHTGFESSDPADGAIVEAPVDTVTLVFTGAAEPTGSGFEALNPTGEIVTPTEATSDDGSTWKLHFDPPLGEGLVGLRWMVKAPDAHPIDGGFSFTITPAPASAEEVPPTTVDPADTGDPDSDRIGADGAGGGSGTQAGGTSQAVTLDDPLGEEQATGGEAGTPAEVDEFLAAEEDPAALVERLGVLARLVTLVGTLLGVGALVFAAAVLRGERRDVRQVLAWVHRAALLAVFGAAGELVAQIAIEGGGDWVASLTLTSISEVLVSSFGVAVGLRLLGGLALAAGARPTVGPADLGRDPVAAMSRLVGAGSVEPSSDHRQRWLPPSGAPSGGQLTLARPHPVDETWRPTAISALAVAGAAALVAAHLFDGHTVVKGNRYVTGLADVIHVLAGAVWVGGVVMLAAVLWRRHRQSRPPQALKLALRLSVVASVALVAVAIAGLALTVIVLDSPSGLWSTEWGRILAIKTGLVAVAATGGAYNHRVLIPALADAPGHPALVARLRVVVTAEAVTLLAVLTATAFLMGAAS